MKHFWITRLQIIYSQADFGSKTHKTQILQVGNIKLPESASWNLNEAAITPRFPLPLLHPSLIQEEKRLLDPSSQTGPIVGGVLSALVVIGIIVGVIFLVRKRHMDEE